MSEEFSFCDLRELFAKANEEKSGDQLAVVTRRPHGYFITHVEGLRFPRVNHQSIGRESRMLNSGDVFEVADEKLEFFLD